MSKKICFIIRRITAREIPRNKSIKSKYKRQSINKEIIKIKPPGLTIILMILIPMTEKKTRRIKM